jgi:hypothetical protein
MIESLTSNEIATQHNSVKLCAYLQEYRPLYEFSKSITSKDGLQGYCKEGQRLYDVSKKAAVADGPSLNDTIEVDRLEYLKFTRATKPCAITGELHSDNFPLKLDYDKEGNLIGTIAERLEFAIINSRSNPKFKKALIEYIQAYS